VLVARSGLGTLNHTLLTLDGLRTRRLEVAALFLVGPPHAANLETLRRRLGSLAIFELDHLDPLTTEAFDGWLAAEPLEDLLR
jgi:dethiobiotin synthetase